MSRYANRLAPPSAHRYHQPQRGYYDEPAGLAPPGRGGYRGGVGERPMDDDEDDETAVATDLSLAQQHVPRRGVQFGENEVEEFNGSEAPEAVLPARSRSRQALSPPVPPPSSSPQQQRPRATSIDGRRSAQPFVPPPPPPQRVVVSDPRYAEMPPPPPVPSRARHDRRPVSSARSTAYDDEPPRAARAGWADDDEMGYPHDDDDDAFTAVATGVATDLDMDDMPASRRGEADDPRMRIAAQQQQQQQLHHQQRLGGAQQSNSFLAVPRPPSRGVTVRRASPSGYDASDFAPPVAGDDDAPPFRAPRPYAPGQGQGQGQGQGRWSAQGHAQAQLLPPPPVAPVQRSISAGGIGRPVSSASSRMRIDDAYEDGYGAPPPPPPQQQQRAVAYERPPAATEERRGRDDEAQDSPLERELIALLKELRFSIALKDFHDTMRVGVQKTLVAEDGMGHAYVKIHVQRLPRHEDIEREKHLKQHWVPLAGSRWEFRTASHRVTVVFKTAALAAYEAQFLTARR
ncbi:hypothetical protein JCM3770_001857 [Rhodotorula araucariae]